MTSSGVLSRSRFVAAECREYMRRRQSLRLDAGPLDRSLRDRRHTTAGQGLMERWHHAQEHLLGIHDRPGMEDVILDRVADILRQGQDRRTSRFAADPNDRIVPVDIVQPKIGDIAGRRARRARSSRMARSRIPMAAARSQDAMMCSISSRGK